MLRVATIPLASFRGEVLQNVKRVAEWLALAAREKINLAVFPETCIVGGANLASLHRRELEALAERLDGPSVCAVADAVESTGVAAGVGLIERARDGRLFNSYVICMPGGQRYCHRKLYAFEHRRIECGERFTVFDTVWGVRIGILIGADNYLIENVRMMALMGATLLIAPHRSYEANHASDVRIRAVSSKRELGAEPGRRVVGANADLGEQSDPASWLRRWLPARAGDNGMFVAFSDGVDVGNESERHPVATAMILDPCGRILAESAGESCTMVSADLDPALIDKSMGRQWLRRRSPSLYGPLAQTSNLASTLAEAPGIARGGSIALSFAVVSRDRLLR
jgi:predicted amidohydrolase